MMWSSDLRACDTALVAPVHERTDRQPNLLFPVSLQSHSHGIDSHGVELCRQASNRGRQASDSCAIVSARHQYGISTVSV